MCWHVCLFIEHVTSVSSLVVTFTLFQYPIYDGASQVVFSVSADTLNFTCARQTKNAGDVGGQCFRPQRPIHWPCKHWSRYPFYCAAKIRRNSVMLQVQNRPFSKDTFNMHCYKISELHNVCSGPIHPIRYTVRSHILKEYILRMPVPAAARSKA